jgi:EAL domain-containing protein (putative c-di-GMP-specific phosphodiesterase class I)
MDNMLLNDPAVPPDRQPKADPDFTFAFQPIFDTHTRAVLSYEALIRGLANEPAFEVLRQVSIDTLFEFDQKARIVAIGLATRLGITCNLNLNFLPQSLEFSPESILTTLEAANRVNLPINRIVLEVLEGEVIHNHSEFAERINEYRRLGLKVAIDDFGAGYSGLNMLVDFQPDKIKLDRQLIQRIGCHGPRQSIVRAINGICSDLGIDVVAEGVETEAEYTWLQDQGIHLFQGYFFARPSFESLPPVHCPGPALPPLRRACEDEIRNLATQPALSSHQHSRSAETIHARS